MRIEVAVVMQVRVPEDTDLEDLLEIDEEGLRFVSQGRVVAEASQIKDYYIDGIGSEEDDEDNWEEEYEPLNTLIQGFLWGSQPQAGVICPTFSKKPVGRISAWTF
jgi:hypothetical protein